MSGGPGITAKDFKSVVAFTVTNQKQVTILAISQVSQLNWLKKREVKMQKNYFFFLLDGQEIEMKKNIIKSLPAF